MPYSRKALKRPSDRHCMTRGELCLFQYSPGLHPAQYLHGLGGRLDWLADHLYGFRSDHSAGAQIKVAFIGAIFSPVKWNPRTGSFLGLRQRSLASSGQPYRRAPCSRLSLCQVVPKMASGQDSIPMFGSMGRLSRNACVSKVGSRLANRITFI